MSKSVDCNNCSAKFQNFKLYIQHLIGQRCRKDSMVQNTKTSPKRKSEEPAGNVSKSVKMTITEAIIPQQNKSQAVNVKNGKARCEFCMRMIKPRGMTQHLNIVHKCKHCDQLVESIDDHIQAAHAQEPCPHCTKLFASKAKVDSHIQEEHLRTCSQCDDTFYTESSLNQHVEDVHASEYCDICDEKLRKADNMMDDHKDKVHGIKSKVMKTFGNGMMFMMVAE